MHRFLSIFNMTHIYLESRYLEKPQTFFLDFFKELRFGKVKSFIVVIMFNSGKFSKTYFISLNTNKIL